MGDSTPLLFGYDIMTIWFTFVTERHDIIVPVLGVGAAFHSRGAEHEQLPADIFRRLILPWSTLPAATVIYYSFQNQPVDCPASLLRSPTWASAPARSRGTRGCGSWWTLPSSPSHMDRTTRLTGGRRFFRNDISVKRPNSDRACCSPKDSSNTSQTEQQKKTKHVVTFLPSAVGLDSERWRGFLPEDEKSLTVSLWAWFS